MAQYFPFSYQEMNLMEGTYTPSEVHTVNNASFCYWQRSLFQRAISIINIDGLPETWSGSIKDFFIYCLFRFGYVAVFDDPKFGITFQPCTLSGQDLYYQPTNALVANPQLSKEMVIGKDCEIIKLTPDWQGIWDIINYYAGKLSHLDNAIDMSIINNKFAFVISAKTKAGAESIKKIFDKINKGVPLVVFDDKYVDVPASKGNSPYNFLERSNLKQSYLTDLQLQDQQSLLAGFDKEIGIPTIPYQKKERFVNYEAMSQIMDATSRSYIWFKELQESFQVVNEHFGLNLTAELRYNPDDMDVIMEDNKGGEEDVIS